MQFYFVVVACYRWVLIQFQRRIIVQSWTYSYAYIFIFILRFPEIAHFQTLQWWKLQKIYYFSLCTFYSFFFLSLYHIHRIVPRRHLCNCVVTVSIYIYIYIWTIMLNLYLYITLYICSIIPLYQYIYRSMNSCSHHK